MKNNSVLSSQAFGLLLCSSSNPFISTQCTDKILWQWKLLWMFMEAPLLFWRGKSLTVVITQHTLNPLRQCWCPYLHSVDTNHNLQLIYTGQKALLFPTTAPQCRNHSQVLQILVKVTEKLRCVLAECVTASKPTAQSRLCSQWLGVNKTSLSARFLFFLCVCVYEIANHIFIRSS